MPDCQEEKVKSKIVVTVQAQKEKHNSSFCNSYGVMPLEQLGVGATVPKRKKGRVVLRGDAVKDDPGSYAALTEQGSSA